MGSNTPGGGTPERQRGPIDCGGGDQVAGQKKYIRLEGDVRTKEGTTPLRASHEYWQEIPDKRRKLTKVSFTVFHW